ncbi:MAG: hypothetical protein Q7S32_00080 [bacterium]|nr:hypothetical protein [bacterium]
MKKAYILSAVLVALVVGLTFNNTSTSAGTVPAIASVSPSSGYPWNTFTITGAHFDATGNTVRIVGPQTYAIAGVTSTAVGTSITFNMSNSFASMAGSIPAGTYKVSVVNSIGASAEYSITLSTTVTPTPVPTSTPTPTPTPGTKSVTFTYPVNGETFKKGSYYTVGWKPVGLKRVDVKVICEGREATLASNLESYESPIINTAGFQPGTDWTDQNECRVKVADVNSNSSWSGPVFKVGTVYSTPTPTPSSAACVPSKTTVNTNEIVTFTSGPSDSSVDYSWSASWYAPGGDPVYGNGSGIFSTKFATSGVKTITLSSFAIGASVTCQVTVVGPSTTPTPTPTPGSSSISISTITPSEGGFDRDFVILGSRFASKFNIYFVPKNPANNRFLMQNQTSRDGGTKITFNVSDYYTKNNFYMPLHGEYEVYVDEGVGLVTSNRSVVNFKKSSTTTPTPTLTPAPVITVAPTLTSISPISGSTVETFTLTGSNFLSVGNTVKFKPKDANEPSFSLVYLPSKDGGTKITFRIEDRVTPNAFFAKVGDYEVSVSHAYGESAVVNVSISAKSATSPSDPIILDGDLIRARGENEVWIVKIMGEKKMKRWLFGPQIFTAYGHLGFHKVKEVSKGTLDEFRTSVLIRKYDDQKVYELAEFVPGVRAVRKWVDSPVFNTRGYGFSEVYIVNENEFKLYTEGSPAN